MTERLKIKGGKILDVNGNSFENGKTFVETNNSWKVLINKDKIICHRERTYSDGVHTYDKSFKLADGLLGLSGGNMDNSYCYFRNQDFQNYLNDNGLTAVKKLTDDKFNVSLHHASYVGGGSASYGIVTDGEICSVEVKTESYLDDYDGIASDDSETEYTINNAHFIIVATNSDYKNNHCTAKILYLRPKCNLPVLQEEIKAKIRGLWSTSRVFVEQIQCK